MKLFFDIRSWTMSTLSLYSLLSCLAISHFFLGGMGYFWPQMFEWIRQLAIFLSTHTTDYEYKQAVYYFHKCNFHVFVFFCG